ncbi:hypothetical protein [Streptomyces sp. NPDC047453]|uniref:hypothetical protein n=1 Tax=Streptomyces sp. NPDC047453 TaxID=3154812 RepID=UPI0033E2E468
MPNSPLAVPSFGLAVWLLSAVLMTALSYHRTPGTDPAPRKRTGAPTLHVAIPGTGA